MQRHPISYEFNARLARLTPDYKAAAAFVVDQIPTELLGPPGMWEHVSACLAAAMSLHAGARGGKIDLLGAQIMLPLDHKPGKTRAAFEELARSGKNCSTTTEAVALMGPEVLLHLEERYGLIPASLLWMRRSGELPAEVVEYFEMIGLDWRSVPMRDGTVRADGIRASELNKMTVENCDSMLSFLGQMWVGSALEQEVVAEPGPKYTGAVS